MIMVRYADDIIEYQTDACDARAIGGILVVVRKSRGDRMRAKLMGNQTGNATAQASASLRTRKMAAAGRNRLL